MVSSGGSQRRTRRGQAAVEDLESTEVHEQTQQRNSKTRRSGPVAGPSALITEPDVKPIITHDQVFIDLDMLDAPSPAVTTATLAEDRIAQTSENRIDTAETRPTTTARSTGTAADLPENLEVLGAGAKVLIHAIRDLRSYGVDGAIAKIDLPKIVVVGDQSAGKSSLIEGISEITVPREAGTCTRAPLEINLEPTEDLPWKCDIELFKKYDYVGGLPPRLDQSGKPPRFWPWEEKVVPTVTKFAVVHDKEALENAIRQAQFATLCPHIYPGEFLGVDITGRSTSVEFSPNIIRLNITGPDLPILTFYDLPGVIAQAQGEGENDHLVRLVKNLVKEYIKEENTLILVTVPMDQDVQNSSASGIVRKLGLTDRCIGVITKPDRAMTDKANDDWRLVLSGKRYPFGHGYFATLQPSQTRLQEGITHREAREEEKKFFKSNDWTRRFPGTEDRVGTNRLASQLSSMLVKSIMNTLPDIRTEVFKQDLFLEEELSKLPGPPSNAVQEVHSTVHAFNARISQRLQDGGKDGFDDLWNAWQTLSIQFKSDIINLRPTIVFGVASQQQTAKRHNESPSKRTLVEIRDSGSEAEADTPSKRSKTNHAAPTRITTPMPVRTKVVVKKEPRAARRRFFLDEIRAILDRANAAGLPGATDPRAVGSMILQTLSNWHEPIQTLLAGLNSKLDDALGQTLTETTSMWQTTDLHREIGAAVQRFKDEQTQLQSKGFQFALRLERRKPMTKDEDAMKQRYLAEIEVLEEKRYAARVKTYVEENEGFAAKITGLDGDSPFAMDVREKLDKRVQAASKDEKICTKLGPDPFDREIKSFAQVRAYYDIAASRFIDTICNYVEADLFPTLEANMLQELREKLGLNQDAEACKETCQRLLEEDPGRARQRRDLQEKKRMLEQASERLTKMNHDMMAGL